MESDLLSPKGLNYENIDWVKETWAKEAQEIYQKLTAVPFGEKGKAAFIELLAKIDELFRGMKTEFPIDLLFDETGNPSSDLEKGLNFLIESPLYQGRHKHSKGEILSSERIAAEWLPRLKDAFEVLSISLKFDKKKNSFPRPYLRDRSSDLLIVFDGLFTGETVEVDILADARMRRMKETHDRFQKWCNSLRMPDALTIMEAAFEEKTIILDSLLSDWFTRAINSYEAFFFEDEAEAETNFATLLEIFSEVFEGTEKQKLIETLPQWLKDNEHDLFKNYGSHEEKMKLVIEYLVKNEGIPAVFTDYWTRNNFPELMHDANIRANVFDTLAAYFGHPVWRIEDVLKNDSYLPVIIKDSSLFFRLMDPLTDQEDNSRDRLFKLENSLAGREGNFGDQSFELENSSELADDSENRSVGVMYLPENEALVSYLSDQIRTLSELIDGASPDDSLRYVRAFAVDFSERISAMEYKEALVQIISLFDVFSTFPAGVRLWKEYKLDLFDFTSAIVFYGIIWANSVGAFNLESKNIVLRHMVQFFSVDDYEEFFQTLDHSIRSSLVIKAEMPEVVEREAHFALLAAALDLGHYALDEYNEYLAKSGRLDNPEVYAGLRYESGFDETEHPFEKIMQALSSSQPDVHNAVMDIFERTINSTKEFNSTRVDPKTGLTVKRTYSRPYAVWLNVGNAHLHLGENSYFLGSRRKNFQRLIAGELGLTFGALTAESKKLRLGYKPPTKKKKINNESVEEGGTAETVDVDKPTESPTPKSNVKLQKTLHRFTNVKNDILTFFSDKSLDSTLKNDLDKLIEELSGCLSDDKAKNIAVEAVLEFLINNVEDFDGVAGIIDSLDNL